MQAVPQEAATVCVCCRPARNCERSCRCVNMHLQQLELERPLNEIFQTPSLGML